MPDEYNVMVHDDEGMPIATVNATALVEDGDEIVKDVREAVES